MLDKMQESDVCKILVITQDFSAYRPATGHWFLACCSSG